MNCPECSTPGSEIVNREFHDDYALAVHYCQECNTEWDRAYGQPEVMEVREV